MTTTWKTVCKKCGEDVYFYPAKLVLETDKETEVGVKKRIVSLTCCSGCYETLEYLFPDDFIQICDGK